MGWRRVSFFGPFLVAIAVLGVEACRPESPPRPAATTSRPAEQATAKKPTVVQAPVPIPKLTKDEVCALPAGRIGAALDGSHAFSAAEPRCVGDHFCDTVDVPPAGSDSCFIANSNIRRAERESRASGQNGARRSTAWDKKSRPENFERVDSHLHLNDQEERLLSENGFVVLDRLGHVSYASAYHDIFQQQLPVFISVDSVLHAMFKANDAMLLNIETTRLGPKLAALLEKLRATLASSKTAYDAETLADLDLYLGVAHALLYPHEQVPHSLFGVEEPITDLAGRASENASLQAVELFGRPRMVDFSQLVPRGHYAMPAMGHEIRYRTQTIGIDAYFRTMMWLSRLELNLVSRDSRSSHPGATPDPRETPREARIAMALADLVSRAGGLAELRDFETTYTLFAGRREDVSVPDLLALMQRAQISPKDADAPVALSKAIGNGYQRSARVHFMPQSAKKLPVIATLFGPRIVPDIAPLTSLVHDSVVDRLSLDAADMGFVLGHDRSKQYLTDYEKFPGLPDKLTNARSSLKDTATKQTNLYGRWLSAVLRLADPADGALPAFMRSTVYADFRLNSALVGYGQIRHTYVLLAGQGYDAYGCEIPDGYVEPAVETYRALIEYTRAAAGLDPKRRKYFRRVEEVLSMLVSISQTELRGEPLSEPQKRWLGMVSEFIPKGGYGGDSGEPPKYTGWYFDLFPDREIGASKSADFVADYFTLTNVDRVRYLGVEGLRLGVFVVDTGGDPRVMVGPVAKGYQAETPIANRLTDASARTAEKTAPWSSYVAPAPKAPPLDLEFFDCKRGERRIVVRSEKALGPVTLTLLDHHGDPTTRSVTKDVSAENTVFVFVPNEGSDEGLHVHVANGSLDTVFGPTVYPLESDTDGLKNLGRPYEVARPALGFGAIPEPPGF